MESFFRIVSYVDYYENGTRVRNAGFLRWRIRQQEHRIELQIKDAQVTGRYPMVEEKTGKKLAEILLEKGTGTYRTTLQGRFFGKERLCYDDIRAFKINLGEGRYLRMIMDLPALDWETGKAEEREKAKETGKAEERERTVNAEAVPVPDSAPPEKEREAPVVSEKERPEERVQTEAVHPLQEDKWKQLCNNYPTIHPFRSGKAFVSLTPKDFVILRKEYQKLVHNSFLLHGFYNYQHMILGKLEEEKESPYYLGVPGVYYERERQAAQMFGFVGFEGVEEPIQNGSYGYYMIPVEI